MAIVAKSHQSNGASTNRPAYRAVFIRDAHRLLASGYARMRPAGFANTSEEVVTEELVAAINEVMESSGAAAWMQRYHVVDDIRVRHPKIRFARKTWPILGSRNWFGNWCWDAYWMKPEVAIDFLVWLHGRKLFDCTAGVCVRPTTSLFRN